MIPAEQPATSLCVLLISLLCGCLPLSAQATSKAAAVATPSPDYPGTLGNHAADKVDDELREILRHAVSSASSFTDRFDAEVWLMAMSDRLKHTVKNPQQRLSLLRKVHQAATQVGLQPEIVLAVIQVESNFDPYAVSRVGAQGMMQVMPFWKKEIGRPEDNLINLDTNLKYGCTILKYYLDKAEGRLAEALARYNGSYGSYRYSIKVMDAWDRWR